MKKHYFFTLLSCFCLSFSGLLAQSDKRIDLSGHWKLFIDIEGAYPFERRSEIPFDDVIVLPTTLDEAQKGLPGDLNSMTHLSRKHTFAGRAWYQKEVTIPHAWDGTTKLLNLERTKVTHVWIDDRYVGSLLLITAPQCYDVTSYLPKGRHTITILVDNGDDCGLPDVIKSSHQWSDDTQTNWNGILGKMNVEAKPALFVRSVQAYTHAAERKATLRTTLVNSQPHSVVAHIDVRGYLFNTSESHSPQPKQVELTLEPGEHQYQFGYELGEDARLWSKYAPNLYRLTLSLSAENTRFDVYDMTIGLRDFTVQGKHFTNNGQTVFLRGKHDGCVFPLTGYAPMDVADWMKYFAILRAYGFNHVRFHSWCPPEAAFEAADLSGFYLQPELPIWGGVAEDMTDPVNAFLLREGKALMDSYGNHPSFVCFATGNELWGSIDGMKSLTNALREHDNRHLYAIGSNFNLGWMGEQGGEDYLVSCRVGGVDDVHFTPHVRSSFSFADAVDGGILNATYPNTAMNFNSGISFSSKPVVAHETGQFQVYPHAGEIAKYTGVLYPSNLIRFIERAQAKHGTEKVEQFFRASGALSMLCYKADMEMSLRTCDLAGYQMLDIQDFPGQGTALVGMLNALMENKGIVSAREFASINGAVVPLWKSDSYTWYADEKLTGELLLFNYPQEDIREVLIDWCLVNEATGQVVEKGTCAGTNVSRGLAEIGGLEIDLSRLSYPAAYRLGLSVRGTAYQNSYPVWVYPRLQKLSSAVKVFTKADEKLLAHLRAGKKAILMPASGTYPEQTVGGLFTNDYWNYSMFKSISENGGKPISPGTLGYLIEHKHPLFKHFPTAYHSDWQWWAPARNARPLILDGLADLPDMIVEGIDNVERNHKLGVIFECAVGRGKLLVCMADLQGSAYKECRQLAHSIYRYVDSAQFAPAGTMSEADLITLFTRQSDTPQIEGVKNVSY